MPRVKLPYTFPSPVRTERLTLRFMTPADAQDIHAYQSRADVCRHLRFEPRDLDQVHEKVAQYSQARTLAAEGDFWQLALECDGRVIGDLYFTIASTEHQTGEIGWSLHPEHQGRGYMSEAAAAVLRLAFTEIGLHRVKAQLDARNDASAALCRRLGMRQEAYFVQDDWCKGEWTDTLVFGQLAAEALEH
jgi:RimJ/RimL family protein N-acetyltransferase